MTNTPCECPICGRNHRHLGAPPFGLSYADACRLSREFNRASDLRSEQDQRINHWLARIIATLHRNTPRTWDDGSVWSGDTCLTEGGLTLDELNRRAHGTARDNGLNAFLNNLRILHSLDQWEIGNDRMRGQWAKFCADPVRFLIRCDDETADAIWDAVVKRQPKGG